MHKIFLSLEECNYLIENCMLNYGGESVIVKKDDKTIYKLYLDYVNRSRKRKKIKALYKDSSLYFLTKPQEIITLKTSNMQLLAGYSMAYDQDDKSLFDREEDFTIPEKLDILYTVKEYLSIMHEENKIFGDVKKDNILINFRTNQVKLCDSDNIYIKGIQPECLTESLHHFLLIHEEFDEAIDYYSLNCLTAEIIGKDHEILKEEEAKRLLTPSKDYPKIYLLDYLKRR